MYLYIIGGYFVSCLIKIIPQCFGFAARMPKKGCVTSNETSSSLASVTSKACIVLRSECFQDQIITFPLPHHLLLVQECPDDLFGLLLPDGLGHPTLVGERAEKVPERGQAPPQLGLVSYKSEIVERHQHTGTKKLKLLLQTSQLTPDRAWASSRTPGPRNGGAARGRRASSCRTTGKQLVAASDHFNFILAIAPR